MMTVEVPPRDDYEQWKTKRQQAHLELTVPSFHSDFCDVRACVCGCGREWRVAGAT